MVLFGAAVAVAVFLLLQSFVHGPGDAEMGIFFECIMVTLCVTDSECV